MAEAGIVKFYVESGKAPYGYITPTSGKNGESPDVYLHYSAARMIRHDGDRPCFAGHEESWHGKLMKPRTPKKGDEVVFVPEVHDGKVFAVVWGYKALWGAYLRWLRARPLVRLLRLDGGAPTVLWEGTNTYALSCQYPLRSVYRGGRMLRLDALESLGAAIEFGFEQISGGRWTSCGDPRVWLCCLPEATITKHGRHLTALRGPCLHS